MSNVALKVVALAAVVATVKAQQKMAIFTNFNIADSDYNETR